jgi:PAS domain S-box-containing protein
MFAAMFGGLGPGILTTVTSALIVDYWFLPPRGIFTFQNSADAIGMALFIIMGILISVVAELYRRRNEKQIKKLRLSAIYNRSLIEASLDPLVTISQEGKITDANEAAAKIRGIIKEKLIGTDFSNYFTEPEKAREGYQQVFTKGFVSNYPLTIKRKDGKLTDVLYNAAVYKDDRGKILGVFAAARDITELKSTTQKLKESYAGLEEKVRDRTQDLENEKIAVQNVLEDLRVEKEALADTNAKDEALLQSIGEGVAAVDKDGKIILMNHAAEQMLGLSAKQVVGKLLVNAWKVLDEKGNPVPEEKRPIAVALKGKTTTTTAGPSYFYTRKNGAAFPVAITVTPVVIENKIIGAVDIFRDMTKEKEQEKLRTDFLSLASHQLRTPLSGTKWLIETIQRKILGAVNPKQKKYLDQIYQVNERMIQLVSEMLGVLRLESESGPIKKETVFISNLYKDISVSMMAAAKSRKIILQSNLKNHKDVAFQTNQEIVKSILECFISNAINYSNPGQEVILDVQEEKAAVVFSVKDNGIGVPEEEQKKLFERFYRASNAKAFKPGGSGLGLSIAKMLAEKIGGKISFESKENKGTTFYLRLPKVNDKII